MKITRLKIEKLFDLFDYDIELDNPENLLILTGPNGYGKTMMLNVIDSFFNKRFLFFRKIVFKEINIFIDSNIEIRINKTGGKSSEVIFTFFEKNQKVEELIHAQKYDEDLANIIDSEVPYVHRVGRNRWHDAHTGKVYTTEEIVEKYPNYLPVDFKSKFLFKNKKVTKILDSIKVHLIKEQRLFKTIINEERSLYVDSNNNYMTDSIKAYADELKDLISDSLTNSFQISQELDSTFPRRLLSENKKLSADSFNKRFAILKAKQDRLKKYGLSGSEQEVPQFDEENAKVLLVYLNDSEKKLGVFDNILNRLELFTNILNQRRFTHKTIKIDKDKGFIFLTSKGNPLDLTDLSSGEQHEVVLLYELIFNAKPDTLVLIDEPEISLHVTWQKDFLADLIRIIELQKMQVLIATHSPQIINNRWDLVYNLEDKALAA